MTDNGVATIDTRLTAWTWLAMFSSVTLAAHLSWDWFYANDKERYVTACTSMSVIFAVIAIVGNCLFPKAFVGQKPELGLTLLLLIFWSAGLGVIMNPDNGIAVGIAIIDGVRNFTILNANLYFGSWAAFVCTCYILGSYVSDNGGYDVRKAPPKTLTWFGLICASVIVLGSSSKYLWEFCDDDPEKTECVRTKYGISMGAIGIVLAGMMVVMNVLNKAGALVETVVATVVFLLSCAAVGLITFGWGPGTFMGNLFFFTWMIWGLSGFLFVTLIYELYASQVLTNNNNNNAESKDTVEQ